MASSSSVQFKKFLFNQVDDIAGNEVFPTKQARGDSGKEPKLHRWQNGEKKSDCMSAAWLSSPKLWMAHSDLSHTWLQRRRWPALPATWGNWYATADEVLSRSPRLHACWTRCPRPILEASVVATMCLKTCSKDTPAHLICVNQSGVTVAANHIPQEPLKLFQWNRCFTPEWI